MKFLIALHINPVVLDALTDEEKAALGEGHGAFIEGLKASGELSPRRRWPIRRRRPWCRCATASRS
jgi:hypothetical protein